MSSNSSYAPPAFGRVVGYVEVLAAWRRYKVSKIYDVSHFQVVCQVRLIVAVHRQHELLSYHAVRNRSTWGSSKSSLYRELGGGVANYWPCLSGKRSAGDLQPTIVPPVCIDRHAADGAVDLRRGRASSHGPRVHGGRYEAARHLVRCDSDYVLVSPVDELPVSYQLR